MGDMHAFYEALKAAYGPSHQIQSPLLFRWKYPTYRQEAILQRWSEHFKGLFSDRPTVLHLTLQTFMELAEDGGIFCGTAVARQDISKVHHG